MEENQIPYPPVEGKTYSLFGASATTSGYYETIRMLADKILEKNVLITVIETIQQCTARKELLTKIIRGSTGESLGSTCLLTIHDTLKPYTIQTQEHSRKLPFLKRIRDKRLATTEEQYHLHMLEIELINRMNQDSFLKTDRKISLQPYCLQDFSVDCKAKDTGFDYQCAHCSKGCFQNHASRLLKKHHIEPFIWKGAGIRKTMGETRAQHKTLGILGIACIPELVTGMRKCMKYKIPVVGLPLNANRCIRWFGEFYPNSVDLAELEKLVSG